MSVSIQVAVRCRPFVCDDQLGVQLLQNSEVEGEVNLLRSKYSKSRFAFSWAWWSAYGFQRHCKEESMNDAESMELTDSSKVYNACGQLIKNQLLDGNAVVLFAYGLSGSGKTFTVFGPDAADDPNSWFKQPTPHNLWGIFPHLAYDIFQMRGDGWKISMKYFQNVVDVVRDLMSPIGQEKMYKEGMRKDKDGFMDIMWCQSAVLQSWDQLRETFLSANGRKAIAPTQFNHQSTRGHCIMTLEVIMPKKGDAHQKQRGRVYVCDLAGTEPAGDIVYAKYKKKTFENGEFEYVYQGPHPNAAKTKELQNQGKKINLSLSEMAQFFMKMAQAIKKKRLKAGQSIPGCNSYFLCRYLKDTMLQARTYLFCAIRPEVKFHPYTFATLGFAKNASVIKLQPKKATVAATKKERALMAELEKMKLMMEQMSKMQASSSSGANSAEVQALQAQLEAAKSKLNAEVNQENTATAAQREQIERQKREYGRRGISLTELARKEAKQPYFLNQDVDEFRSERFMYILSKEETVFGTDIKPMDFGIVDHHCTVRKGADNALTLVGGKGETFHNGARVEDGAEVEMHAGDRLVLSSEMMLLCVPGAEPDGDVMSAEEIAREYSQAKMSNKDSAEMLALQQQKEMWEKQKAEMQRQLEEMKAKASDQNQAAAAQAAAQAAAMKKQMEEEEAKQVEQQNRQIMLDLIPKVDEADRMLRLMDRDILHCEALLRVGLSEDNSFQTPQVKVKIENRQSDDVIFIDPYEFEQVMKVMRNEVNYLAAHFEDHTNYEVSASHDPMNMFYDFTFEIGTAVLFNEPLLYYLETDDEERMVEIKNVGDPRGRYGNLECVWTPMCSEDADPDSDENLNNLPDIQDPAELIGKSWTFRFEIKGITGLPIIADKCYCQYTFDGKEYTTTVVEKTTDHPVFNYSCVHHVPEVTQEFIDRMQNHSMNVHVWVSAYISNPPGSQIATGNTKIAKNMGFNTGKDLSTENQELKKMVVLLQRENKALKEQLREFQSGVASAIGEAKAKDAALNGGN